MPLECHGSFPSNDEEISQRYILAVLNIGIVEVNAILASKETRLQSFVVWVIEIDATIRTSKSFFLVEVHEIMASHPQNASRELALRTLIISARDREFTNELLH